nr:putative AMP-binding protein [uncultured bacterium]
MADGALRAVTITQASRIHDLSPDPSACHDDKCHCASAQDSMGVSMNLAKVIEGHGADRRALVDGDREVTFGELRELVSKLRAQLAARGVGHGDAVALAAGNEVHFATASLAVLGVGAIVMPVNPQTPPAELRLRVELVGPKVLLAGDSAVAMIGLDDRLGVEVLDMNALEAQASTDPDPGICFVNPDDRAFYMATSGVSGAPKVAVLSHHNLRWVQEAMAGGLDPLQPEDVTLGCLPFGHIFGLNVVLLYGLRVGSCTVLQRVFDADESLELISRHGVTVLAGAPPMWQRWAKAEAPDDSLSTIRYAASGAAALPLGVFESIRDRFGVEVAQGYGLTETSPVVTLSRGHAVRPSSVGKVLDGVTVALVDEDGSPVDVGDEGEVVVKGPGVFDGYLDDQAMTDAVLTADGWFWTGDVGIFDEDGYLYLVDRIKDVVIVSGFNVYPAEVETALMKHPDVKGAIVTGQANEMTGEMVVAHVSGTATEEQLRAHLAEHLSRYKWPAQYFFLDELPIAPNGKPIRRALR